MSEAHLRFVGANVLAVLALLFASGACFSQADYAREQRWAEEITPGLVVGDAVYLTQTSGHKFLAIYAGKATRPAVIVVHGMGVHPDWALIGSLRSGLFDQGYATLSVQMPVLTADATAEAYAQLFPEAVDRLKSAVAYLRTRGHRRIALVSHTMGSRMSNVFLGGSANSGVDAWVCIGVSNGEITDYGKIRVPVLDIYGEHDFPQVVQKAGARISILKALKGSAQVEVAGADHYFAGSETELVRQIRQFLDQRIR